VTWEAIEGNDCALKSVWEANLNHEDIAPIFEGLRDFMLHFVEKNSIHLNYIGTFLELLKLYESKVLTLMATRRCKSGDRLSRECDLAQGLMTVARFFRSNARRDIRHVIQTLFPTCKFASRATLARQAAWKLLLESSFPTSDILQRTVSRYKAKLWLNLVRPGALLSENVVRILGKASGELCGYSRP
jgi:hypothetical protein